MIYKISSVAALILGLIFLIGLVSPIVAVYQPDAAIEWFLPLENNWLALLFKLNAGFSDVHFDMLYGVNPMDLGILALAATMHLGLYVALRRTVRIGSILAVIQPFLGIALFVATQLVGRSTVMGAGLVISFAMLRSHIFGKGIAIIGILASVLLLVGDFGTGDGMHSTVLAISVGMGYVLLVIWLFLVAWRLFRLGGIK